MIRFEHVTRHYGEAESPALHEISVEFYRGDFVFLIGASGSGKSTLLRMILREGLPQKGRVTVAGQNLGLMLERRVPEYRRSIGMVFQDFRLLPDKSVYDNVAFAMRVIGAPRHSIRKQVMKTLSRVKLEHLAKRYPHEISGGEQQRAAIARAIVNSPAIVLADEPTGNLDPRASAEVMKILRWINASGTTVIMATHDRAIVDRMSRRVVQLHKGQLVRDEPNGSYDPAEGSGAWEILRQEEAATGLRASDPMPVRTALTSVVPAADSHDSAPAAADTAAEDSAAAPAAEAEEPHGRTHSEGHNEPQHFRVTWPHEEQQAAPTQPDSAIDAADLPQFDQVTGADFDSLPLPQTAPMNPEPEDPPEQAAPPSSDTVTRPVPRPKASAAQAGYTDSQRTADQLRASQGRLFRRRRRG